MRLSHRTLFVAAGLLSPGLAAAETCPDKPAAYPDGPYWTATWIDDREETVYALRAPCKVYVGQTYPIVATVKDQANPNGWVATSWKITDNGALVGGGGFNVIATTGGQWTQTFWVRYDVLIEEHRLEFAFTDLGSGSGSHWWKGGLVGDVTLDPYPTNAAPVLDPVGEIAAREREEVTLQLVATDPDAGDTITYWADGLPDGATLDPDTGLFRWTPTEEGTYTVDFYATDDGSPAAEDVETATIVVADVPTAPELAAEIQDTVTTLGLSRSVRNSYDAHAKKIPTFLAAGQLEAATAQVEALAHKLRQDLEKGDVTEAQAEELLELCSELWTLLQEG